MLPVLEKMLILQDRDQKLAQLEVELGGVDPQRRLLQGKLAALVTSLEALRSKVMHLETARKELELEVQSRKELIDKYASQQFQTRRNEEYQALAHEILTCKAEIAKIEDRELELMEQIDVAQKTVADTAGAIEDTREATGQQLAALTERETRLRAHRAEMARGREELAAQVNGGMLPRYERLRKSKGERVVVGVEHSVCGGCHMKLPAQIVVGCQADQEVMLCTNCGRVLYYAPGMDLVVAD
jgi:hypothetical protein